MSAIFGEVLVFPHGDEEIKLRVFGDEFYARYETLDGYSVVFDDSLGKYCYADLKNGHFVSTGTEVTGPVAAEIAPHLKEDLSVQTKLHQSRFHELLPDLTDPRINRSSRPSNELRRTHGPNNGLLDGMVVTQGNVLGLTVLVEFADVSTSVTRNDVDEMLNGENYHKNGNYCSAREYFKMMSSGKLNYSNLVVGPVRLSHPRDYYKENLFVKEAMDIVVNDLHVDLSQFDSTGEGIVDAINFLYAGMSLYEGNLWPHNSVTELEYNGIRTYFYLLTGLGQPNTISIGTFCHETGHLLCRFPDIYDYGKRDNDLDKSAGIGDYCLMGSGNHLNNGLTPSPVCAYLRNLAGWCDNHIDLNNGGAFTAKHGNYDTIMKFRLDKPNEYFLIENRTALDLDKNLPSSGLAIYHCDTEGSNEYEEGTPTRHYQVALLQADGNRDLERNLNNGDRGDLFGEVTGIAISSNTNPSSKRWDRTDSGLVISNVTNPGVNIEFQVESTL
ncbi:metalloprotease [Paenibacillus sp. IHB B 3084]|uniref:M6 family metalloprotease domain-containing protein n=1 Tax=Paenibacillus sp. IHB B 3084 TaxID=867076 RepID=UPI000722C591|nr:M6 family metalloprotease domain-containing protein [Paenibacillus sp. IHB B 3084]ALP37954.1 metalloprotease [Paenibacillus sp. IHB B 3084]